MSWGWEIDEPWKAYEVWEQLNQPPNGEGPKRKEDDRPCEQEEEQ